MATKTKPKHVIKLNKGSDLSKHQQRWARLRAYDVDQLAEVSELARRSLIGVIGVDEVGRGSLVGPVVAAAVCLPTKLSEKKYDWVLSIDDSKAAHLNRSKRLALKNHIQTHARWGIGEASVEEIAELNIVNASLLAGCRALEQLAKQFDCDLNDYLTIMDGRQKIPHLNPRYIHAPMRAQVKGDQHSAAIAAASIVAKAERDSMVDQYALQYPGYGWDTNAGYPTQAHQKAIATLGITPVHRRSYKTVQAALELSDGLYQQTLS